MTPTRWLQVTLDGGSECARCDEPVGVVATRWGPDMDRDGEYVVRAWRCQVTGEVVCDDCHNKDKDKGQ